MRMPECVHPTTRNTQLVQDRPEPFLHDLVLAVRIPVSIREQEALRIRLPRKKELAQHPFEQKRHRYRRNACLTLRSLQLRVIRGLPDTEQTILEIKVIHRETKNFARTQPGHGCYR